MSALAVLTTILRLLLEPSLANEVGAHVAGRADLAHEVGLICRRESWGCRRIGVHVGHVARRPAAVCDVSHESVPVALSRWIGNRDCRRCDDGLIRLDGGWVGCGCKNRGIGWVIVNYCDEALARRPRACAIDKETRP